MIFTRITVNPGQMAGVPCIRGLRIPVASIVGMIADNMTEDEILNAYPDLEYEDIQEALRYTDETIREREIPLVMS
ncbi:DUF433 domain-containing protein [Candidatus Magnetobacterium casense]|uniref:DUF433 domain-containing protein n=2 Tax=Candidatus Magnetobacterium TaxID=40118 RepID=A0ABS6RYJ8_9BACT|nr:DUF433 domain-containing protein [Candidatus Magnetobacterium casensis]MBV6341720.1 DUF433 domain-containing protein [Candidatus Magnetobacterium casensis]